MERPRITPHTLVAEALALGPEIALLFLEWRTECVGCSLVRFCTLEDVSRYYALDLDAMIQEIETRSIAYGSHSHS